ncbi:hypothetical protein DAKH74_048310 [Maudiozyma humilis]|uniref:Uncharacterized protein n=1 Tax=Maudiozyma humilis TaxID=51915 RepID=A0AAV5S3D1_MAUHU|nr:hypothetical protein DAKH74_048310 [Kazachstania humilis]
MSGSFWKFGQEYSSESSVARILNRAFIKIDKGTEPASGTAVDDSASGSGSAAAHVPNSDDGSNAYSESSEMDQDSADAEGAHADANTATTRLPDQEEEYVNYEPNLSVLDELLDDEEMYTELMCSNFQLLIYLKYPQVLDVLVDYVITDHKASQRDKESDNSSSHDLYKTDEQQKQDEEDSKANGEETPEDAAARRANMAAEILSADVWQISTALTERPEVLNKLWSVVKDKEPISTEISTFFMKINERLLDTDMASMVAFIKQQNILVDKCLLHIVNPPLMDFLLKVISTDKPDEPTGILQKLKREHFIDKLLEKLGPESDATTQCAAADFLKAFIAISGNCIDEVASGIGPNELSRELASPRIIQKLITNMLNGGTCLSNGVGIIIELIRKNNSDYDYVQVMHTTLETHPPTDRDPIYLGHMLSLFAQNISKFNTILVENTTPLLDTSFGKIEPVGFERFKICELIAELLHCSNMSLLNEKRAPQVIAERDTAREAFVKKQEENSAEGEEMTTQLNSLQLTSSSQPMELDEVTQETIEESDVIDDSDEAMQKLQNEPVVGDELKIALFDTQIITTILEMLFHFSWNNFLHNVVFDIIQQVFNGPLKISFNKYLIKDLLSRAEITNAIIRGDAESAKREKENGMRLGYMGHLTLIAEEIVKFSIYLDELKLSFTSPVISERLADQDWKHYIDTTLMDTREKYDMVLGEIVDENGEIINDNGDANMDYNDDNMQDEQIENGDADMNIDDVQDVDEDDTYHDMALDEQEEMERDGLGGDNESNEVSSPVSTDLERTISNTASKRGNEESGGEYLDTYDKDTEGNTSPDNSDKTNSKSFLITGLRKRSHPASPEVQDEDIFQQQQYNPAHRSTSDDEDDQDSNSGSGSGSSSSDSMSSSSSSSSSANSSANSSSNNSDEETEPASTPADSDVLLHRTSNVAYSQVHSPFEDDELSDDSDAELEGNLNDDYTYNSDDDDDDDEEDDDYEAYSLCRSTSKENAAWNDDSHNSRR